MSTVKGGNVRVDVILPAFNAQNTLTRAVESVIRQSALGQLIIVDDASTDGTRELIQTLCEQYANIVPVLLDENVGPAHARNLAMQHSTAAWVTLLDSDDWMDDNRLSTLLDYAVQADADIVADDIFLHNVDGEPARLWQSAPFTPFFMNAAFFAQMNIAEMTGEAREFGYIKPMFRADILKRTPEPWRRSLRIMEDYDLYLRCLVAGDRFLFAPAAGYHYDRGTASRAHRSNDLRTIVKLDREVAKSIKDREARYWLGRHADGLEALVLWVEIFGDRNIFAVPRAVIGSLQRPRLGLYLWRHFVEKLRGRRTAPPMTRDIPKGTPPDLFSS